MGHTQTMGEYMSYREQTCLPCRDRGYHRQRFTRTASICIALAFLTFGVGSGRADTYYVHAANGNDDNPGTESLPWKTMNQVSSATQQGDTVRILQWDDGMADTQWPWGRLYRSQSVRKNSIEWKFGEVAVIGQFVTTDYWVVGPATIQTISPASAQYRQVSPKDGSVRDVTIHGSMINPRDLVPAPDDAPHGFDSRVFGYRSSLNVAAPISLQPDQSLVSVRSWKLEDPGCPAWNSTVKSPRPALKDCAILTCVSAPPAQPGFRPAYCGESKTYHTLSDMDLSILPNLMPVPATPSFQTLYDQIDRCWAPDIPCSWVGGHVHPSTNMPDYGREMAAYANDVALALMLDEATMISAHGYPSDWKEKLAIVLIQFGIDSYGIVSNGGGWGWVGGGHGHGRKWPILFAGLALDAENLKAIGTTHGANAKHVHFMEDAQKFYLSQADVDRFPKVVTRTNCRVEATDPYKIYDDGGQDWSIADDGSTLPYRADEKLQDYWLMWDVGGHDQLVRVSGYSGNVLRTLYPLSPAAGKTVRLRLFPPERLGMPEWGERHINYPSKDYYSRGYRIATTGNSLAGAHLCALALRTRDDQTSAKQLWNWPVFFDYMDMYMAETFSARWLRQVSSFAEQMWDTYRPDYGPIWPVGQADPLTGNRAPVLVRIGTRTITVGQTLSLAIAATDLDEDPLTFTASGVPGNATFTEQTFSWTPSSDEIGSYQVTFTASDGTAQDSETVMIIVQRPNTAPILAAIGGQSVSENEPLTFSINATDADGDAISYSLTNAPSGAHLTGQAFSWTPSYSQAGSYDVTFVASDGRDQDSQTVTISVANVNRPPVFAALGDRSVDATDMLSFTVSATDPDGDNLAYSAGGLPSSANLTGQTFSWTPGYGEAGSYEITFTVSDGELTDSETMTLLVAALSPDDAAPAVARCAPVPDTIQVPLNNLVTLHVTDAGAGVNAESVTIAVDDVIVYQGNTDSYTSERGQCNRSGTKNDYKFTYQHHETFEFDHTATVTVNAADLAGNAMNEYTYSFVTEMRVFGSNQRVSQSVGAPGKSGPVTASDAAGNLWAVWHTGPENSRDIYAAKRAAGTDAFGTPVQLTTDSGDQCNPDLAAGADGSVYVVWQDNRRGHWDIFASICSDGERFSREVLVADCNDNEIYPAIATDHQSSGSVYVAWQDDRNGNQDIYVAKSVNAFAVSDVAQITSDPADQLKPDITIDGQDKACVVWTDMRAGQADIYGAALDSGVWMEAPFVAGAGDQIDSAVAAEPDTSTLHLLWVNNLSGNSDIYYARSDGLPDNPLAGVSIIDDTSGADQTAPSIACGGSQNVFACWRDARHVGAYGTDTDLYFADLSSGTANTNVLVSDDGTGANQGEPAVGVDQYDHPYVVWTDDRDNATEIYYAATTFIDPVPLDSKIVVASEGAVIGTDPAAIRAPEDVSIVVPPGACRTNVRIMISKILNPPISPVDCLGSYDFGPSGIDFDQPVTVTIPYRFSGTGGNATPYWYDSLTGALSQQGIAEVQNIVVSSGLNALRFKTTHFTPFYVVDGDADVATTDSDGGGGCSISATGSGSPGQLLVPYAIVAVVMAVIRRRDSKKARNDTEA